MEDVTVVGIDLPKSVIQLHRATASGVPPSGKKFSRFQVFIPLEAAAEVAMRPSMQFVSVESAGHSCGQWFSIHVVYWCACAMRLSTRWAGI